MATFADLVEKLEKLDAASESLKEYNPQEFQDKARSVIAKIFVWGFFIAIGVVVLLTMTYNIIIFKGCDIVQEPCRNQLLSIKDMLVATIGYIGSPLGFVLGYYFKAKEH